MERSKGGREVVVTAETVQVGLAKVRTTAEEEKVLRLRYGARVDPRAPLPRAAGNNAELADELLLIEMQLLRGLKARTQATMGTATAAKGSAKDKIVKALKKKS
ncbi:MAG: hypothetical protein K1X89_23970 [Myxococcaceae bacterium]|nr:hypothetical protein [Myxococcaceae bacterium]